MRLGSTPVGLVGCGRWGRFILRDLVALGCEVTVVSRTEAHRAHAREAGARQVVDDLSALPAVAGVVVAVPVSAHADVVERVLLRGVPVFCEKPLTNDGARAAQLARAGEGRLFVMDKWRYHPGIRRLAEIARREELGKVVGLRTTRVQPGCPYTDVDAVWILAPHDLSIAIEVLGFVPEPRTAVVEHDGAVIVGLSACWEPPRGWSSRSPPATGSTDGRSGCPAKAARPSWRTVMPPTCSYNAACRWA